MNARLETVRRLRRAFALALVAVGGVVVGSAGATGRAATADGYFDETRARTLFAFDVVSIPHTQNLRLEMRAPERHPANPVLRRGAPGTPDASGVQFYGSVLRDGGRFRMWYIACDDDTANRVASSRWRPAYAESVDGVTWTKPDLGLVRFRGSRRNNLVALGGDWGCINLKVIKDDADPDPQRRYKMTTHVYFRHRTRLGTLLPFVSADGFTWRPVKDVAPVKAELRREDLLLPIVHLEPCGGLYQWDGWFYLTGQNALPGVHPYQGRVTRIYRSADFVRWEPTNLVGFVRDTQLQWLGPGRSREGEQNHEGISVWQRGNVLLGLYGRWHGAADWRDVTVDLGFVLSNDGLRFREPQREWTWLQRGPDGAWDQGGLLQGQGFENRGAQTLIYYGAWDPRATGGPAVPRGGVGVVLLPRDRFGALRVDESGLGPGAYQAPAIVSELVTSSVTMPAGRPPRVFVNADGLGAHAALRLELLDHHERPVPGRVATVGTSGFQVPVRWEGADTSAVPERIRFRIRFEGARRTAIRFHALYLLPPEG